jgi:hypothetical protein
MIHIPNWVSQCYSIYAFRMTPFSISSKIDSRYKIRVLLASYSTHQRHTYGFS